MRIGKKRLRINSSRQRLLNEITLFSELIPAGSMVLDAGAGDAPYKRLFDHAQYESADFEQVDKAYEPSTYVCSLEHIPVEDCRFDFIIFTQVMEHLRDPGAVLCELNRVLKPGGALLYSGPLFYEEHEQPYDYFRYTQYGLRELFEASGFTIERLDWLEGYFGTMGYQLHAMDRNLPLNHKDYGGGIVGLSVLPLMVVLKMVFRACSILFHRLELRCKFKRRGYPKNYIAIVRKRAHTV